MDNCDENRKKELMRKSKSWLVDAFINAMKLSEEILNKLDGKAIYGVCEYDTEKELEYISINKEQIKEIIQS